MRLFAKNGWRAIFETRMAGSASALYKRDYGLIEARNNPDYSSIIDRPLIQYYTCPVYYDIIQSRDKDFVIFDSVDEPSGEFSFWRPNYVKSLTTADLVTTSAKKLYEVALKYNKNTLHIPNAADYDHFSNIDHLRTYPPPEKLRKLDRSKPTVGFHGALASWLDWPLIKSISKNIDCNLVLIGPPYNISPATFSGLGKNLILTGEIYYKKLPQYLTYFDVCILPFNVSEMTSGCNPIKMWEYLATGKPVVATCIPEAKAVSEVYTASNERKFLKLINRALRESDPELKAARKARARENSWELQARRVMDAVEGLL